MSNVMTHQEGTGCHTRLFPVIADVKTRKWNFLLEEHNKLSELPTLLILYHAVLSFHYLS